MQLRQMRYIHYPKTLFDVSRVMNPIENKRAPKHTTRFIYAKAGSPTRGDTQGDGTLILVPKERRRSQGNEGAALEGGSEYTTDTGVQGR